MLRSQPLEPCLAGPQGSWLPALLGRRRSAGLGRACLGDSSWVGVQGAEACLKVRIGKQVLTQPLSPHTTPGKRTLNPSCCRETGTAQHLSSGTSNRQGRQLLHSGGISDHLGKPYGSANAGSEDQRGKVTYPRSQGVAPQLQLAVHSEALSAYSYVAQGDTGTFVWGGQTLHFALAPHGNNR